MREKSEGRQAQAGLAGDEDEDTARIADPGADERIAGTRARFSRSHCERHSAAATAGERLSLFASGQKGALSLITTWVMT